MESVFFVVLSMDCLIKVSIGDFLSVCEKVIETLNKRNINIENCLHNHAVFILLYIFMSFLPGTYRLQAKFQFGF